jgi:hypothetical protein
MKNKTHSRQFPIFKRTLLSVIMATHAFGTVAQIQENTETDEATVEVIYL